MRAALSVSLAILMGTAYSQPVAAQEGAPLVTLERRTCIPADGHAPLRCRISSASSITTARVYFHSEAFQEDYYLELRRDADGLYYAPLPMVDAGVTKGVRYRVVVKNAAGFEAATEPASVPVAVCLSSLSAEEAAYASALVIGLTSSTLPSIPQGFRCDGIVSEITAAGELRPNDPCRKGGVPLPVLIGGGAVVLGTGTYIIASSGGGGEPVVSPTRRP